MASNEGAPGWMKQEYAERESKGHRRQQESYVKADLSSLHAADNRAPFPSSVVTGVKIIAWLMLLNTCIGAGFILVSMVTPGGTEVTNAFGDPIGSTLTLADYVTPIRMAISTGIGIALSIIVWKIVEE